MPTSSPRPYVSPEENETYGRGDEVDKMLERKGDKENNFFFKQPQNKILPHYKIPPRYTKSRLWKLEHILF